MFQPGLANLLEPVVIAGSAAHSIQVLWDDRMIVIRQCKPIASLLSRCYRNRSHRQADKVSITSKLLHTGQIANDDIRSRGLMLGASREPRTPSGGIASSNWPLTSVWISIGCMLAPIEISPTTEPASEGRPSASAQLG